MTDVTAFLSKVVDWARLESGLAGLALVGSHARGSPREGSDIDLVLVFDSPEKYLEDQGWVENFGQPVRRTVEDWGKVTSLDL